MRRRRLERRRQKEGLENEKGEEKKMERGR